MTRCSLNDAGVSPPTGGEHPGSFKVQPTNALERSITTMTTTKFFEVSIPAITFKRTISDEATGEVEQYDEAIDAARVSVPFGIDKADAITKALHLHRRNYGIPASHHIMATARTVSLVIGTTTRSASGTARVPKALAR